MTSSHNCLFRSTETTKEKVISPLCLRGDVFTALREREIRFPLFVAPSSSLSHFSHRLRMESTLFLARSAFPVTAAAGGKDARFRFAATGLPRTASASVVIVAALEKGAGASGNGAKKTGGAGGGGRVPNSNYVVPLDLTPSFCRPLKEILRDLNKRVPDNIIDPADNSIPWYLSSLPPFPPFFSDPSAAFLFVDFPLIRIWHRVQMWFVLDPDLLTFEHQPHFMVNCGK